MKFQLLLNHFAKSLSNKILILIFLTKFSYSGKNNSYSFFSIRQIDYKLPLNHIPNFITFRI